MTATLADDLFRCNSVNENVLIAIKASLNFAPNGPINNIPTLVQKMVWCGPGNKPLSEQIVTQFTDAYMRHQEEMAPSM